MKLSIGIVGLPNVGKSTLFKNLTAQNINIANYPFATIDPNVGIVPVPDERLERLNELSISKKKVPAVVEFYDIAGLVKGANKGEGLGNQFLSHIRDTQAIVIVLRAFSDPEIVHVENSVDPVRDMGIILTELVLKDLETVGKRLSKLEAEARGGEKKAKANLEILKKVEVCLNKNELPTAYRGEEIVCELQLLTAKRQIYLLNGKPEEVPENLLSRIKDLGADHLIADLAEGSDQAISDLIRKSYGILDLISFFTTGEDETRAWTVVKGTKAPQAAGAIHTDFEHKFIRAEVITWDKLISVAQAAGAKGEAAWSAARQKGFLRLEGKEYVVQDGDVIVVRHG